MDLDQDQEPVEKAETIEAPAAPTDDPIVGTLGVHLTLRGTGPKPTLDAVTLALLGLDVGEGVVVKVTEIEWR